MLDGAAALQVIRHIHPRVSVVLTPGSIDEKDTLNNALPSPHVKSISKPFTANDLLVTLAEALKLVE